MPRGLELKIEMGNDAFSDGYKGKELARILRLLANTLKNGASASEGRLRDINGNTVGEWRISDEPGATPNSDLHGEFSLRIDLENDAFSDGYEGKEIDRIIRKLAAEVEAGIGTDGGKLRDINGTTVGEWNVSDEPVASPPKGP